MALITGLGPRTGAFGVLTTSETTAEVSRDITTDGSLSVGAEGKHSYVSQAKSSSGGADAEPDANSKTQETLKSEPADKAMDKQQEQVNSKIKNDQKVKDSTNNTVKDSADPSSGGKLSVAAA